MDELNFDLETLELDDAFIGVPTGDEIQSEAQKARILCRQRCTQCLVNVVRKDGNCTIPCRSCHQIKAVLAHAKVCPKKTNGGCPICQQLVSLCCYHARDCVETGCTVPFCDKIKQTLQKLGQQ